jgi:hypothetical protein
MLKIIHFIGDADHKQTETLDINRLIGSYRDSATYGGHLVNIR